MNKDKYALITGASSGIGLELSQLFAADQYNLVLVARNRMKIEQLKKEYEDKYQIQVVVIPEDLSQTDGPEKVYQKVSEEGIRINILVNNAGFGLHGYFKDTDINRELEMIRLNISALTHVTKLFLPDMIKEKFGRIMNVASTAGFIPGPLMSVYYATKAYVLSFSEALYNELKGNGVTVTTLCPGPTATEFSRVANVEKSNLFNSPLMGTMTAEQVAKIGYKAMKKGKRTVITGLMNKLAIIPSVRFLPKNSVLATTRWLMEHR